MLFLARTRSIVSGYSIHIQSGLKAVALLPVKPRPANVEMISILQERPAWLPLYK